MPLTYNLRSYIFRNHIHHNISWNLNIFRLNTKILLFLLIYLFAQLYCENNSALSLDFSYCSISSKAKKAHGNVEAFRVFLLFHSPAVSTQSTCPPTSLSTYLQQHTDRCDQGSLATFQVQISPSSILVVPAILFLERERISIS